MMKAITGIVLLALLFITIGMVVFAHNRSTRLRLAEERLQSTFYAIDSLNTEMNHRSAIISQLERDREQLMAYNNVLDSLLAIQSHQTREAEAHVLIYTQSDDSLLVDLNRIIMSLPHQGAGSPPD